MEGMEFRLKAYQWSDGLKGHAICCPPHLSIKKKKTRAQKSPKCKSQPLGQVKLSPETTILHFPSSMISLVQKPVYFPISSSQAPRDPSFGLQIIPRPPRKSHDLGETFPPRYLFLEQLVGRLVQKERSGFEFLHSFLLTVYE